MSTRWPLPVRPRAISAAMMPLHAVMPDRWSDSEIPMGRGCCRSVRRLSNPLSDWPTVSYPGRDAYGPSLPKPVIEHHTKPGLLRDTSS